MDVVFCFLIFCFYLQVMDRAGLEGVGCCDKVGYYGMVRTTRLSRRVYYYLFAIHYFPSSLL